MGVTRTSSPINPPIKAWFKTNDEWVSVLVTRMIHEGGVPKNEVELPDGSKKKVLNDLLRFGRKPRGR